VYVCEGKDAGSDSCGDPQPQQEHIWLTLV